MPGTKRNSSRPRTIRTPVSTTCQYQQQSQQSSQQAPAPAPAPSSMTDQLNQLAALHQQGALTDDEFTAAKAKLFGT